MLSMHNFYFDPKVTGSLTTRLCLKAQLGASMGFREHTVPLHYSPKWGCISLVLAYHPSIYGFKMKIPYITHAFWTYLYLSHRSGEIYLGWWKLVVAAHNQPWYLRSTFGKGQHFLPTPSTNCPLQFICWLQNILQK